MLVARGAVGAGEHVEALELVAGVADVAAHGRVGPLARAVAVEAQVELDQVADGVDLVVAELQRLHPLAGESWRRPRRGGGRSPCRRRSKRRVLGLPTSCMRAAKREHEVGAGGDVAALGEPRLQVDRLLQDGQRVLVDVLVAVVLVALEACSAGSSGRTRSARPVSTSRLEAEAGMGRADELHQLVADPLGRDDLDPVGHLGHGGDHRGRRRRSRAGRRSARPASSAAGRRRRTARGCRACGSPGGPGPPRRRTDPPSRGPGAGPPSR